MTSNDCEQRIARGHWAEDETLRRCRCPIGPRNTWSNLAYLAAGAHLAWHGAWIMAASLALLAIGSGLYHALKTRWANFLDWAGMYASMSTLMLHGVLPREPLVNVAVIGLALIVIFAFAEPHFSATMGVLFIAAAIPALIVGDLLLALGAILLFGLGYLCWRLDRSRKLGLWGHALWHKLTAAAMLVLYLAQRAIA